MIPVGDLEHLLRRTEFVARPARVSALSSLTLEQAVDDILDVSLNPSDATDPATVTDSQGRPTIRPEVLVNWWLDRMVAVPRPIAERMTFFWHGRLTSAYEKVTSPFLLLAQNRTYRRLALGDYRALLHAMAIDPAMLLYLDNARNVKAAPNQNFARELLELFTLGVGNYTEADVAGVSRAWTGHTYNRTTASYTFNPANHDKGQKTIFGVTRAWDGPDVLDHLLDDATLRTIASRHLARAMWESFAHPGAPANVVNQLADGFVAGGFDIKALVRSMLLRPEFYSQTAKTGLVRPPVDYVVAVLEASGFAASVANPLYHMVNMGQVPFNPPNVSGWRPNSAWINATAWAARMSLAGKVAVQMQASGRFGGFGSLSAPAVADRTSNIARVRLSARSRAVIEGIVTTERRFALAGSAGEVGSSIAATFDSPEFNLS
ncbi:MAG: DUF1800 family protein [Acidimicrobiia bacterium]